jgi:hypothetical protein
MPNLAAQLLQNQLDLAILESELSTLRGIEAKRCGVIFGVYTYEKYFSTKCIKNTKIRKVL